MTIRILCLALCVLEAAGCSVVNKTGGPDAYIPLNQAVHSQIRSTSVFVGRDPANDDNVVTQSMATPQGGGLAAVFGSLIAGAIISENENDRQQRQHAGLDFRKVLVAYNYSSKFRQGLEQRVANLNWLHADGAQKEPKFLSGDYSRLVTRVNTDAILVVDSYYKLTVDSKKFELVANVVLYPVAADLKRLVRDKASDYPALFHNRYTVEFAEPGKKHVIGFWTQNNRLPRLLDAGIAALLDTAMADLNNTTGRGTVTLGDREAGVIGKITRLKTGEYRIIGNLSRM